MKVFEGNHVSVLGLSLAAATLALALGATPARAEEGSGCSTGSCTYWASGSSSAGKCGTYEDGVGFKTCVCAQTGTSNSQQQDRCKT
jgi:hypothetical protein